MPYRNPARHRLTLAAALLVTSAGCEAKQASGAAAAQPSVRALRAIPGCEGCEAAWERDPATLGPRISMASPDEPGEPMLLRGTVYHADGKTPARGIILYLHQTNAAGLYANGSDESEWSRRHGRLRGWLKTSADGRYEVRTVKPGRYPDGRGPAHVHFTVVEPGKDPYWIDDVVFAGEPGVDAAYRGGRENRGGPGIVTLQRDLAARWIANRDIRLEIKRRN